jgi:hypothetical protein
MSNPFPVQDITPFNKSDLLSFRSQFLNSNPVAIAIDGPAQLAYLPRYAPCSAVHPALSSCASVPLDRFFAVFKWMLPIYGALHFIPAVLFKWKKFMQDPGKILLKATGGSMRSSAFLGVFVVIYQSAYFFITFFPCSVSFVKIRIYSSS